MQPNDLPVMLTVRDRRCVVVGAGGVGVRRARLLAEAGARVVLIAPQVHPSARLVGAEIHERRFEPSDLDHAILVVAATDDAQVNEAIGHAAAERGVLVNRADEAAAGNLAFMTSHRDGPLTVAVHSGGASASAAVLVRDELVRALDPDWARLLTHARPMRQAIQQRVTDPAKRTELLRRLTDEDAMKTLKEGGEAALKALYADMMRGLV